MNIETNEFGAAQVASMGSEAFVPAGRTRDAGQGTAWLGAAWEMFKQAPGIWIALVVIYIVLAMVLSFIPMIGQLALTLLGPVFMGGILLGCKALDDGQELRIDHLFAGFKEKLGPLVIVGALYMGGLVVIGILVFGLGAMLFGANALANLGSGAMGMNAGSAIMSVLLLCCLVLLLALPLAMAMWFAPALVVFHDMQPVAAMQSSFFASLKNIMPMLIYGLILMVLAIVATIPFGLGWLVLLPVLLASSYAAYRDIFVQA